MYTLRNVAANVHFAIFAKQNRKSPILARIILLICRSEVQGRVSVISALRTLLVFVVTPYIHSRNIR